MSIREGRGMPLRDYPLRSEERSHHGRGANPPSRHLWVGNLSHSLSESAFARYFLRYGELESVAFQPGRSYAFVNYRNDEDAFAAIKDLQGFELAGNPMRIEFAKGEKSSTPSADYTEGWDGPRSKSRGSPLRQDYAATRRPSPEPPRVSKSKMKEKDADPSEVLWVGFPAQLKVDEFILRKAFSPFGDIEKITAFPGRTYAFIRYRNVASAFRAREALHGKLFGNPRVHICFARNESGTSSTRERSTSNAPLSPYAESYERAGHFERYRSDRNFSDRSPPYIPDMDPGFDMVGSKRSRLRPGEIDDRGMRMFQGLERNIHDYPDSPLRNVNSRIHEFSHHDKPRQDPLYDDPWDLPEDTSLLLGAKKLKTNTMPLDNELPEYPFSDLENVKRLLPHDHRKSTLDGSYDPRHPEHRRIPNHSMNPSEAFGKRDDDHRNMPLDHYRDGLVPPPHQSRRRLAASDSREKEVWKWEGIIAKGGSSVCQARCFPVGKPPDVVLPEYLDCNARTSLDMLAKHYYQATSAHVVFFVPANDPDISYYNEFRDYLEEKQRVAVAKLDETTTLFLVPPSEFSEKVLKVPGNLSISGVVLRLENSSSGYGTIPHNERNETYIPPSQSNVIHQRPISPSGSYLPPPPPPPPQFPGNMSSAPMRTPSHNTRPMNPQGYELPHSNAPADHAYYSMPRPSQESAHTTDYNPELSRNPFSGNSRFSGQEKPRVPSSSMVQTPSEQLAQLKSSLLGQQGRMGSTSGAAEYQPQANVNQSAQSFPISQNYNLQNNQGRPEHMLNLVASQRDQASVQNAGQEDGEGDPQNRLQATLQLAAALLQQIQQGKGN